MSVTRKEHWNHVYATHQPSEVSWYQPVLARSMAHIRKSGVPTQAPIIDIGGGVSTLVDTLHNSDYSDLTVLDISSRALDESRRRLGAAAATIQWIEADVLEFEPLRRYFLWHDRAVFHFLTDADSVDRYLNTLRTALVPGGYFVLCTFGPDGPVRCSNLATQRYSVDDLTRLLETDFRLLAFDLEDHQTPTGNWQQFLYTSWRLRA